ncbi:hypothetical protein [Cesiribacter sp. SM1]|uniref:hypothetical protein n=1 Tax=Cesiribacter sp. SM1 TaxID=2861196 RepID=UPI001CD75105|nr:hypothetical protein [Cesiribacter sp. SM1]
MNSKRTLLTLLFLCFSLLAWSQQGEEGSWAEGADPEEYKTEVDSVAEQPEPEEAPAWREKVFFGAGGGLQFSSFATVIELMPSVGYRITPKVHAGVIGIYQYVRDRGYQLNIHNYGASLFARYFVVQQFYATAEYEQISYGFAVPGRETNRQWVDRPMLGAGYFQQGSRGGGFFISILYDLNYTNSPGYPYNSPLVYRAGLIF